MLKYLYLSELTQRLINFPFVLLPLWLFKIPCALLYKGLIVPLIPRSVPVRLKKILITFILVGSQNFKTHESIFSNSRNRFTLVKV